MLGETEVVVGGQIEFGADGRAGAQRPAQAGGAPLGRDVVEPGQWIQTDARHRRSSSNGELNTVQVSARATAIIAEVIWPISSAVQM